MNHRAGVIVWAALVAVSLAIPSFARSQSSVPNTGSRQSKADKGGPKYTDLPPALPEWSMTDDKFNLQLIQIETILPIFESTLTDLDRSISNLQGLSFQNGKAIQDDVKFFRTEIESTRQQITSLKNSRDAFGEEVLASELTQLVTDAVDLDKDLTGIEYEENIDAILEHRQKLSLPHPSLANIAGHLPMVALELTWDVKARITYLESRVSACYEKH